MLAEVEVRSVKKHKSRYLSGYRTTNTLNSIKLGLIYNLSQQQLHLSVFLIHLRGLALPVIMLSYALHIYPGWLPNLPPGSLSESL